MSLQVQSNREIIKGELDSNSTSLDQAYFSNCNQDTAKDALLREDVQDRAVRVIRPVGPVGEAYTYTDPTASQDLSSEAYQNGERAYRIAIAEGMDPVTADKSRWEAMIRTSSSFTEEKQVAVSEKEEQKKTPEEIGQDPIAESKPGELSPKHGGPSLSAQDDPTINAASVPLGYLQQRILSRSRESFFEASPVASYNTLREAEQRSLADREGSRFSWSINPPSLAV